jgi:hypothetical protein
VSVRHLESGSWPTPWSALLIFRPRMKSCLVIFVRHERRGAYSPSAVVWHVGVGGVPEAPVAHHNIHFGEEWARPLRR